VERAAGDDVAEEVAADAAAAEEHDRQDRPRLRLRHLDSRIGFGSSRPEIRALSVFPSAGKESFGSSVRVWAVPPKLI
jgi:hypothetical protein